VADVNKILTPPVSSGTLNIGYTPGSSGILAAPAPGASAMVAAAASAPPSITNDLSWLTVIPNTSNNTLSIQFAANPGNNPRSGTFLVDGEPITVTQAGQYFPSTTLRPSRQEVDAAAGNFVLDISSNTQWSITNLPDWITADRASGEGNAMVVLRFEANPFNASRSAVIRVNDESLVVSQKGGVLTGTFVGMFDHSAGHISMSVAASGAVTATVMLEFEKVILRGQLQGQLALLTGSRATGEVLTLTVPMVNSSGHAFSATGVAGTLSSPSRNDSATLYWSGAYGVKNPGTWKRGQVFTISIPGWGHAGVANALIDPLGNCRLTGKLPEGTSFAWEGKMAFENRIVFHQIVKRSYHPEGDLVLAGDLSFSNSLGRWTGVIRTKARNSGPETADVAGEPFDPNKYDGHLIFPMTGWGPNAWVGFSPTSIDPKPVDRLIKIGNSGAIQYSPVGKGDLFTFNVDRVAGTFTGSFSARSPLSGGTGYFSGVFLQGSNRGVGFYIGPAGVGGVEVRPLALGTGTFQGSNRLQAVSGQDFDHQVTVPFGVSSYSLQGTLPDGLFFNTSTGAFSGIPTGSGTFYLIVKAHGSGGRQAARLLVLDLQPHLQAQSGTYSGLVGESTPRQETSGKIQITLARNWNFTASMVINGTSHRFRGIIDPVLGTWSGSIPIAVGRQYFVTLSLVDRGASSQINAQVSEPTLGMQSNALLDRHSFERVYDRCPAEGYYTFSTSGLDGYPEMAMGFGTARIQSDGTVLLAGTLGDGTRWTSSTVVVRRPDRLILPFYFNPYANRSGGGVSGEARFLAEENVFASWTPDNMHRGFWWKSPNPRDKFYPSGFTRPLQMTGSIFRQPVAKSPVFSSPSGPLVFTKFAGGTAVEHERSTFQVLGNRLVMPGSDRLSISVDPRTGAFSGTYQPEIGSTRRDRLVGFIDREAQYGFGQWISPSGIHDVIFSGQ
jgi:hypothetical protein